MKCYNTKKKRGIQQYNKIYMTYINIGTTIIFEQGDRYKILFLLSIVFTLETSRTLPKHYPLSE